MPWSPLPTSDGPGGPGPSPMARALDSVLAGLGGPTVAAIVTLHERWADVVGAEVAPHARPLGVDEGCLGISVDSPAWASHLRWSEAEILTRVEALLGPGHVTSVKLRVSRR